MKNANIDFDSMKVFKHFNPMFQLCFKAVPSFVEKKEEHHQKQHPAHQPFSYILITKPTNNNLPQKIFQCKTLCPIFNHNSQSYILVKGDNLWDYYKSKKLKSLIFTQDEIWVFMRQIVQALLKLGQYGITHSHLKQYAIYRVGSYSYQLLYHGEVKSMVQLCQNNEYYWYDFYLAPEQLSMGTDKQSNVNKNGKRASQYRHYQQQQHPYHYPSTQQKSPTFSLGLMVLNMMNLQQFSKCFYDKQRVCVDWNIVKQKLHNSQRKYSSKLVQVIKSCLMQFVEQRVTLKQLYSQIIKCQNQCVIINDRFKLRVYHLLINSQRNRHSLKSASVNHSNKNINTKNSSQKKQQSFSKQKQKQKSLQNQQKLKKQQHLKKSSTQKRSNSKHSLSSSGKKTQQSSSPKNSYVTKINDKQKPTEVIKKWSTSSSSLLLNRQQQQQQKQKYSIAKSNSKQQIINKNNNKKILNNNNSQQKQQQQQLQIINFDRGTFGGDTLPLLSKQKQKSVQTTILTTNKERFTPIRNHHNIQYDNSQQTQYQDDRIQNTIIHNHIKIEAQNYLDNNNNNNIINNNNNYDNNENNYYNQEQIQSIHMHLNSPNIVVKIDNNNSKRNSQTTTKFFNKQYQQQQQQKIKVNQTQKQLFDDQNQQQKQFQKEKLVTFGGGCENLQQQNVLNTQQQNVLNTQQQNVLNTQQQNVLNTQQQNVLNTQQQNVLNTQPILSTPQRAINHVQQPKRQLSQQLSHKQTHSQKPTKPLTIQDLKLKQLDFIQSQNQIQHFKSLINNNQKSITLKLQSCLLPIEILQQSISNQPGIYIQGNLYYGPFKNGRRNGMGLQIFPENQYYYGNFEDDLFHGQGFYYWNKNQYFLGMFQNGTKKFGTLIGPKLNYTGQFKNSKKMNGIGTQKIKTGQIFTGQWKQGKKHGIGQLIEITNDRFIGQWQNGKKSGYGEYILSDYPQQGFKVKAIWYKNEIISDTIVQYSNGNQYQGPLVDFQKHGKGFYKFKKGGYFKGTFYKDNPTHGELVYKNGQKYIGSLRNMKRHGFGEYHYSDGTIKKGNWIDDVRVEKDANY